MKEEISSGEAISGAPLGVVWPMLRIQREWLKRNGPNRIDSLRI